MLPAGIATSQNGCGTSRYGGANHAAVPRQEFQRDNILLVGNAAGFAESFYGEGIYFALKSAVIAAKALSASFDRPRDNEFTRLVKAEQARTRRDAWRLRATRKRLFHAWRKPKSWG